MKLILPKQRGELLRDFVRRLPPKFRAALVEDAINGPGRGCDLLCHKMGWGGRGRRPVGKATYRAIIAYAAAK